MAQQAEKRRPILAQDGPVDVVAATVHPDAAEKPGAQQHSHHCLEHVAQNDDEGQRPAEGAVKVGQPRVAAAMGAHIVPQNVFGHDDRPVEAAAEICAHGGQQHQDQGMDSTHFQHDLIPPYRPFGEWRG